MYIFTLTKSAKIAPNSQTQSKQLQSKQLLDKILDISYLPHNGGLPKTHLKMIKSYFSNPSSTAIDSNVAETLHILRVELKRLKPKIQHPKTQEALSEIIHDLDKLFDNHLSGVSFENSNNDNLLACLKRVFKFEFTERSSSSVEHPSPKPNRTYDKPWRITTPKQRPQSPKRPSSLITSTLDPVNCLLIQLRKTMNDLPDKNEDLKKELIILASTLYKKLPRSQRWQIDNTHLPDLLSSQTSTEYNFNAFVKDFSKKDDNVKCIYLNIILKLIATLPEQSSSSSTLTHDSSRDPMSNVIIALNTYINPTLPDIISGRISSYKIHRLH